MIGIDEELKATEAAKIVLSATNPNSEATIRVLRQAKYVAAVAMTILASDKPLNDARHAVVIITDPAAKQEKIEKAKGAILDLEGALKARQETRVTEGDEL